MTAVANATTRTAIIQSPKEIRRARVLGIFYLVMAVVVYFVFNRGVEADSDASFGMSLPQDAVQLPAAVVPVRGFTLAVVVLFVFLAAMQLTRGFGKKANVILGVALGVFALAFLAWAAADGSFNMIGMLNSTVLRAVPICLGALAGVLCERVGVINIAIEGMMLMGAFVGVVLASATGSLTVGVISALLSGLVLAWVLGVLAIRYRVDQIIIGVFINIFALGLTSFLTSRILVNIPDLNNSPRAQPIAIPFLSDIPVLGPVLFKNNIFVYAMFFFVALLQWALFRTRWGLRARSVGEKPKAADTLGINVFRTRYRNVMFGGMMAGLGGAFFTLGSVGRFDENMTAGRGFIGLAAMIFGRYHPVGALGAALVFGFADSLQQKLAILKTPIPSEFLLMAPYIVTIIVVAGLVGRTRIPAADGQPYVKE